jgi:hypothetical protein
LFKKKTNIRISFSSGKLIGGASVTAAKYLNPSNNNIAINFFGGWHHASKIYLKIRNISIERNEFRTIGSIGILLYQ